MKKTSDSLFYSQFSEDTWVSIPHGYGGEDGVPVKSLIRLSWII